MNNGSLSKKSTKPRYIAFLSALVLSIALYVLCKSCRIWQLVSLIGLFSGIITLKPRFGFLSTFSGVFAGWSLLLAIQSIRYPIAGSASLLANIIGLNNSMWPLLVILTLFSGSIVAGFSGLAGSYLRSILEK